MYLGNLSKILIPELYLVTGKVTCGKQHIKILEADSYDLGNNINDTKARNYIYYI